MTDAPQDADAAPEACTEAVPPADMPITAVLSEWECMLGQSIGQAARSYVELFVSQQAELARSEGGGGAVCLALPAEATDPILGFSLFLQDRFRSGGTLDLPQGAGRLSGSGAGRADGTLETLTNLAPQLKEPALLELANLLARCMANGPDDEAWTLASLLRVFFQVNWNDARELMQEIAFRCGEVICRLARSQASVDCARVMALGCDLLNRNAQFTQEYECRALPPGCGLDSQCCEMPEGRRIGGNTVAPLSFYFVVRRTGQVCRRAKTMWV